MRINFKKNPIRLLLTFSILAILVIIFSLSTCVVARESGPYYTHDPSPGPTQLRRIEGLWFFTVAGTNVTGKLEFYWSGNAWAGRIWHDAYQQWEVLTDIIFDPRTGEMQFTRPNYGQRYIGTLSGNQLVGTFGYEGRTYSWEASRGAERQGPLIDLRRIQGLWFFTVAGINVTGKFEFHWDGRVWSGRIWHDAYQQWEVLTDIIFDPRTGEIQFTRPNYGQRYIGTLSSNQLMGTFGYEGRTYSWEARRPR